MKKMSKSLIGYTTGEPFEQNADAEDLIEKNAGFVYLVHNSILSKSYIGKKLFRHRKNKNSVESDWKTYWGSSDDLRHDIERFGIENFSRAIVKICRTKSECSYEEARLQFVYDVLHNPARWYNAWISCRVTRRHLGVKA
jgi:hypothetical protein